MLNTFTLLYTPRYRNLGQSEQRRMVKGGLSRQTDLCQQSRRRPDESVARLNRCYQASVQIEYSVQVSVSGHWGAIELLSRPECSSGWNQHQTQPIMTNRYSYCWDDLTVSLSTLFQNWGLQVVCVPRTGDRGPRWTRQKNPPMKSSFSAGSLQLCVDHQISRYHPDQQPDRSSSRMIFEGKEQKGISSTVVVVLVS